MPRLHLRVGPGEHHLAREALWMLQPRHRLLDLRRAPCRPRSRRSASPSCGQARAPGACSERIGSSTKPALPDSLAPGCSAAGSAIERPRPRKARRSVSASVKRGEPELSSTKCASSIDRIARRARPPARKDDAVVRADLRLDEHLGEGRMRAVVLGSGASTSSAKDVTSMKRLVSPSFQSVTRRPSPSPSLIDDALDLGAQRADRLEEAGLLVAEMGLRLLAGTLLSARRWPTTIRRSRRRAGTRSVPIRSSVGSACQRVTAMSPKRL